MDWRSGSVLPRWRTWNGWGCIVLCWLGACSTLERGRLRPPTECMHVCTPHQTGLFFTARRCSLPHVSPSQLQEERRAAAARKGGLVTYKQQISFGVHVLAMMAAFYAFGHVAGMALTRNKTAVSLFLQCWARC